jgi:hypothetical protein
MTKVHLRRAPERWFRIQDWRSGARSQQIRRLVNKPGFQHLTFFSFSLAREVLARYFIGQLFLGP